jgi:hypothetical protein
VYIFVRKDQRFDKSNILFYCIEQISEICAIQLETRASNLIILSLYRAPSADFNQFAKRLNGTIKYLYNPKFEFLICGNINIDSLDENKVKETKYIIKNI